MDKATINSKNRRYTALAWILAILVLAVAVPLNLIFDRLNITADMTPNSMYSLTKTTTNYLDELDQRGIVVDVYFLTEMAELEGDLEVLALYRTLQNYDAHPCFNLIDFDPDSDPAQLRKLNSDNQYNLSDGDLLFVYGDMVKRLPGNMLYTYGTDENDVVTQAEFRGENLFTGYMKSVVEGELPMIYFLEGHGEIGLDSVSQLRANLKNNNYGSDSLNLTTARGVPDDCRILVIANPQYDITEDEYAKIYAYTQNGGNVSVLIAPNESKTPYTNIERLLNSYCIGMSYDRVTETDENRYSHKEPYAMMCDLTEASEGSTENLTEELLPKNNTLPTYMPYSRSFYTAYGANIATVNMDPLILTATTARSDPYGGSLLDPTPKTGQSLALAMYSVDTMRSGSKLIVFGSGDFITDEGSRQAFFINPLLLFQTSVTWMYNSDVDMNIADKQRTYDYLNVKSSGEASTLIAVFAGFPILIAAAGVLIWLRRRNG
ncbi:MAG: Gldg family protein [Oscillospiraceae bacterium]|nr:Gldg family protein [Oscillospiraceae bacterium]